MHLHYITINSYNRKPASQLTIARGLLNVSTNRIGITTFPQKILSLSRRVTMCVWNHYVLTRKSGAKHWLSRDMTNDRTLTLATSDGGAYRRDHVHLRKTQEPPPIIQQDDGSTTPSNATWLKPAAENCNHPADEDARQNRQTQAAGSQWEPATSDWEVFTCSNAQKTMFAWRKACSRIVSFRQFHYNCFFLFKERMLQYVISIARLFIVHVILDIFDDCITLYWWCLYHSLG